MNHLFLQAYRFAQKKHEGQKYNNQEFMVHPNLTAKILYAMSDFENFDENLIAAALLHDTLEDTNTTYEELEQEFGIIIASLVQEVTKQGSNTFPNLKTQRGVMLKFADRLSNISNMQNWSEEKRQKYMFEKSKFWK